MVTKSTAAPASRAPARRPPTRPPGSVAADEAVQRNLTVFRLPVVGRVSLPPLEHLAWYGGVAALTAAELIEWPVALVLAVGRVLADNRSHRTLRSFGEALEHTT
jgi:hypothetical protein